MVHVLIQNKRLPEEKGEGWVKSAKGRDCMVIMVTRLIVVYYFVVYTNFELPCCTSVT